MVIRSLFAASRRSRDETKVGGNEGMSIRLQIATAKGNTYLDPSYEIPLSCETRIPFQNQLTLSTFDEAGVTRITWATVIEHRRKPRWHPSQIV